MKIFIMSLFVLVLTAKIVYSQKNNIKENSVDLIQVMKTAGYTKINFVTQLNMELWRDSLFECKKTINGLSYKQRHAEAEKNGSRRRVVLCYSTNRISMYDGEENPPFPLLVTEDSAYEVYNNFGNITAAGSLEDEERRELYRENEME